MYVWAHVCGGVRAHSTQAYRSQRAEVSCLPRLLLQLVFETRLLKESGINSAIQLVRLASKLALQTLLSRLLQCWGYRSVHATTPCFLKTWVPEIPIQPSCLHGCILRADPYLQNPEQVPGPEPGTCHTLERCCIN